MHVPKSPQTNDRIRTSNYGNDKAVADFNVVLVEDLMEFVILGEVYMYELEESSADVSLYILAVWWVVPDYVALSVYVPLSNEDLDAFESDLLNMIKHIKFRKTHDQFQDQLREDIKKINASTKAFIPADKTTNYYKLDSELHDKLLTNSITTTYKKANDSAIHTINNEAWEHCH
eukprot:gene17314-biopygen6275